MSTSGRRPSMTPGEALEFHKDTLVVDTKLPVNQGIIYTDKMRAAMSEWVAEGRLSRSQIWAQLCAMSVKELQESPEARRLNSDNHSCR